MQIKKIKCCKYIYNTKSKARKLVFTVITTKVEHYGDSLIFGPRPGQSVLEERGRTIKSYFHFWLLASIY